MNSMEASFGWTFPPAPIRYHGTANFKCNSPVRSRHGYGRTDRWRRPHRIDARQPTRTAQDPRNDRGPAFRAGAADAGDGGACAHARDLLQARDRGARARAGPSRHRRQHVVGRKVGGAHPAGRYRQEHQPVSLRPDAGQDDNERIMGEHLRNWGMAVQWNTELTGIRQEPGHVTATLKQPDGSIREVRTAYVAGCDGGHSAVRELCGITFPGAAYEHVFFVADTEATGPMVAEELNVYLWREGFHLFFPMRGKDRWRVIGILPKKLQGRDDVTFEELSPDIRREAGANLNFKECSWFSIYHIHHRAAEKFRDRRCFLLGDAAHVHSPVGGQGMNTGLQDAYNLAWKLALVVKGHADAALLDSYEAERIPVAQRLLATTDRAFMLVVSDRWIAGLFRTRILARIAAFAMR